MMTINEKKIAPAAITFNVLCRFEELGAPTDAWGRLDFALLRAYLAVSAGCGVEEAGKMIEAHVIGGGDLTELRDAFTAAVEASDFLRAPRMRGTEPAENADNE